MILTMGSPLILTYLLTLILVSSGFRIEKRQLGSIVPENLGSLISNAASGQIQLTGHNLANVMSFPVFQMPSLNMFGTAGSTTTPTSTSRPTGSTTRQKRNDDLLERALTESLFASLEQERKNSSVDVEGDDSKMGKTSSSSSGLGIVSLGSSSQPTRSGAGQISSLTGNEGHVNGTDSQNATQPAGTEGHSSSAARRLPPLLLESPGLENYSKPLFENQEPAAVLQSANHHVTNNESSTMDGINETPVNVTNWLENDSEVMRNHTNGNNAKSNDEGHVEIHGSSSFSTVPLKPVSENKTDGTVHSKTQDMGSIQSHVGPFLNTYSIMGAQLQSMWNAVKRWNGTWIGSSDGSQNDTLGLPVATLPGVVVNLTNTDWADQWPSTNTSDHLTENQSANLEHLVPETGLPKDGMIFSLSDAAAETIFKVFANESHEQRGSSSAVSANMTYPYEQIGDSSTVTPISPVPDNVTVMTGAHGSPSSISSDGTSLQNQTFSMGATEMIENVGMSLQNENTSNIDTKVLHVMHAGSELEIGEGSTRRLGSGSTEGARREQLLFMFQASGLVNTNRSLEVPLTNVSNQISTAEKFDDPLSTVFTNESHEAGGLLSSVSPNVTYAYEELVATSTLISTTLGMQNVTVIPAALESPSNISMDSSSLQPSKQTFLTPAPENAPESSLIDPQKVNTSSTDTKVPFSLNAGAELDSGEGSTSTRRLVAVSTEGSRREQLVFMLQATGFAKTNRTLETAPVNSTSEEIWTPQKFNETFSKNPVFWEEFFRNASYPSNTTRASVFGIYDLLDDTDSNSESNSSVAAQQAATMNPTTTTAFLDQNGAGTANTSMENEPPLNETTSKPLEDELALGNGETTLTTPLTTVQTTLTHNPDQDTIHKDVQDPSSSLSHTLPSNRQQFGASQSATTPGVETASSSEEPNSTTVIPTVITTLNKPSVPAIPHDPDVASAYIEGIVALQNNSQLDSTSTEEDASHSARNSDVVSSELNSTTAGQSHKITPAETALPLPAASVEPLPSNSSTDISANILPGSVSSTATPESSANAGYVHDTSVFVNNTTLLAILSITNQLVEPEANMDAGSPSPSSTIRSTEPASTQPHVAGEHSGEGSSNKRVSVQADPRSDFEDSPPSKHSAIQSSSTGTRIEQSASGLRSFEDDDYTEFWSIVAEMKRRSRPYGRRAMDSPQIKELVRDRQGIPVTSFSCKSTALQPGYYADIESGCRSFHRCVEGGGKYSFNCPLGTLFSQVFLVCDHERNVDCQEQVKHAEYINSRINNYPRTQTYTGNKFLRVSIEKRGPESPNKLVPADTVSSSTTAIFHEDSPVSSTSSSSESTSPIAQNPPVDAASLSSESSSVDVASSTAAPTTRLHVRPDLGIPNTSYLGMDFDPRTNIRPSSSEQDGVLAPVTD